MLPAATVLRVCTYQPRSARRRARAPGRRGAPVRAAPFPRNKAGPGAQTRRGPAPQPPVTRPPAARRGPQAAAFGPLVRSWKAIGSRPSARAWGRPWPAHSRAARGPPAPRAARPHPRPPVRRPARPRRAQARAGPAAPKRPRPAARTRAAVTFSTPTGGPETLSPARARAPSSVPPAGPCCRLPRPRAPVGLAALQPSAFGPKPFVPAPAPAPSLPSPFALRGPPPGGRPGPRRPQGPSLNRCDKRATLPPAGPHSVPPPALWPPLPRPLRPPLGHAGSDTHAAPGLPSETPGVGAFTRLRTPRPAPAAAGVNTLACKRESTAVRGRRGQTGNGSPERSEGRA